MSDAARLKCTIHVGGLDATITAPLLTQAFLPFGEIISIQLPESPTAANATINPNDPSAATADGAAAHRGFALIEYETQVDAAAAIDNMDQSVLAGRVLKVSQAKPSSRERPGEGLGSKVAVWEQEGWLARHVISKEDKAAAQNAQEGLNRRRAVDPMQGLEGLDVAGPVRPE